MPFAVRAAILLYTLTRLAFLLKHDFAAAILEFDDVIALVAFLLVTFSVPRDPGSAVLRCRFPRFWKATDTKRLAKGLSFG